MFGMRETVITLTPIAGALFAPTLQELRLRPSDDQQHLLICWGDEALALYGGMGASPEHIVLADGETRSVEEVLELLALET